MDSMLNALYNVLIAVGIAAGIGLIVFIFWTAYFIPIIKLRQHNIEKERLQAEAHKIELGKANAVLVIEDKKKEYNELVLMVDAKRRELEKLKYASEDESESKPKGKKSTSK